MQPLPKSFTLTLHHSRPKYANLALPQIANEDNDADHAQTSKEISFRGISRLYSAYAAARDEKKEAALLHQLRQ
jgi:hypothetical protein